MYRVIIVDDEPWIVQSITETLPWARYGMRVVGGFTKASVALDAILAEKPDVVFTDIRMPVISGIRLMQTLREQQCDAEIIVISGFDQFDFARDSLRMGAFDYCLKPLNESYMADLLYRLKARLDQKAQIKNSQLLEALTGDPAQSENEAILRAVPKRFDGYQVICLHSETDNAAILSDIFPNSVEFIRFSSGKYRYYLANAAQNLFDILPANKRFPEFSGSIGFSRFGSIQDLPALISEAAIASEMHFTTGTSGGCIYHEPRIAKLLSAVQRFSLLTGEDAGEESDRLSAELSACVCSEALSVEELCFLGNQLILNTASKPQPRDLTGDALCSDWRDLLDRFSSLEDYCQHISSTCQPYQAALPEAGGSSLKGSTIGMMLQYLNENYTRPIYLKDLAEKFYVNKNYASLLFKRYTGMSYSDYLNSLRLNRAKELLSSTALTISEVAEQSGYSDYFYFNKLFKKTFGITPAKYRRQFSI